MLRVFELFKMPDLVDLEDIVSLADGLIQFGGWANHSPAIPRWAFVWAQHWESCITDLWASISTQAVIVYHAPDAEARAGTGHAEEGW